MVFPIKRRRSRGVRGDEDAGLQLLAEAREQVFGLPIEVLDRTFASARLTHAISQRVAQQIAFPTTGELSLGPASDAPEIVGREVRGVLTRRAKIHKGRFPSDRAGADLPWEQQTEFRALQRLDCMDGVAEICTQPLTIEYYCPFLQQRRKAFPDIYIEYYDAPALFEIKRDLSRLKLDAALRLILLEFLFRRAGVEYRLWQESEICEQPAYGNAVWLGRYKSVRLSDADRMALMQVFGQSPEHRLQDVAQALNDPDRMRTYAMLLRNWVLSEADSDVREDPLIRLNPRLLGKVP